MGRCGIFIFNPCFFPWQRFSSDSWNSIEARSDFGLLSSTDKHVHQEYHVGIAQPMGSFLLSRETLWIFTRNWTGYRSPRWSTSSTMWTEWTHFRIENLARGRSELQFRGLQLNLYCLLRVFYLIFNRSYLISINIEVYLVLINLHSHMVHIWVLTVQF